MEGLTNNEPLVIITVALLSSLTTIAVAWIGQKANKKIKTSPPKTAAGYERLLSYLEEQLDKKDSEIKELRGIAETCRDRYNTERNKRIDAEELSERRRAKLLEVSRTHGVDVSALV